MEPFIPQARPQHGRPQRNNLHLTHLPSECICRHPWTESLWTRLLSGGQEEVGGREVSCAEMGRREVERNRRKRKYEGRTEDGGKPEEGNERTLDREGVWHVCVCAHIHTRSHSSLAETGLLHQFILCYGSKSHFSFVFVCDGDAAQCLKHASKTSAMEMLSQVSKA